MSAGPQSQLTRRDAQLPDVPGKAHAVIGYVKTGENFEVDFHAVHHSGAEELIQVCSDPSAPGTMDRELRSLMSVGGFNPGAARRLLVLTQDQTASVPVTGIDVQPVYEWILNYAR